jgi:hypothetical protein
VEGLLKETIPTLHSLKAAGAIDAIGLGINEWDSGYEILASAHVDCVLLAGRCNSPPLILRSLQS